MMVHPPCPYIMLQLYKLVANYFHCKDNGTKTIVFASKHEVEHQLLKSLSHKKYKPWCMLQKKPYFFLLFT